MLIVYFVFLFFHSESFIGMVCEYILIFMVQLWNCAPANWSLNSCMAILEDWNCGSVGAAKTGDDPLESWGKLVRSELEAGTGLEH